jgi:metallo-beta-lactamase class B
MSVKFAACLAPLALAACATPSAVPLADADASQRAWTEACGDFDEWDKPGPPFRIYGRTYYVGTCGITSLLVVGPGGHTLIDSGTEKGAEIVLDNIRRLGFDPQDVEAILTSHEHFDHVGGIARLQAATGAPIVTSRDAAAVLRTGVAGTGDPQAASGHPPFTPVTGKIAILEGEHPQLIGDRQFRPVFTPGHTPGALSWTWQECDGADCLTLAYVDSLNPISADGYRFSDHPAYLAAFRKGVAKVAALDCDIVLAPHPSSAALRERMLGNRPLADATGCNRYAESVTDRLDKRLSAEASGG